MNFCKEKLTIKIFRIEKMPSAEFTAAAEEVKKLSKEPSNDEKLQVYSLYKVSLQTRTQN